MIASTNVGMTRKKSAIRMMSESVRPPANPLRIPSPAPRTTVITVASSPITIDTRVACTVRFSIERPSSSVPSG